MFSKKTVTPTPSPDPVAAAPPPPAPVMRHRPTTLSSTFEELMQNSGSK
jgi:hypothetical protein